MNRMRYIFALAMMTLALTAAGQGFRGGVLRYERVHKNNFWNGSRNVTGIRQDSVSRSFAEIYGDYEEGTLRDTWQPEQGWSAGATTASIQHLEKISFAGSFTFEQTEGYGMCGSMFIKPGFYPVDVLEFTPGRKSLQTYSFDGGVSYDVAPSWRIGAKMDFESANIAKRKDLRHSNKRLEMAVAPGFMYHAGDLAIGVSYIFEKTSETIEAEQVGTSESSYWAFLDKGMMYGAHSVWTGSGIHLQESGVNGFPVSDFSNGIALQAQWAGLFGEISYLNTQGRIGEKEYVWFHFPGNRVDAQAGYTFNDRVMRHNALVKFGWSRLGLDENVLEKVTENGVNTVLNHGSNRILARETVSVAPEYEIFNELMELSARARLEWKNGVGSQMYPYVHEQSMFTYSAGIGMRLFLGGLDIGLNGDVTGGKVSEDERVENEASGVQGKPFRLEEWYQKTIDYQTCTKLSVNLAVRYNFKNGIYVGLDLNVLTKGLDYDAEYNRGRYGLRLGYNF